MLHGYIDAEAQASTLQDAFRHKIIAWSALVLSICALLMLICHAVKAFDIGGEVGKVGCDESSHPTTRNQSTTILL